MNRSNFDTLSLPSDTRNSEVSSSNKNKKNLKLANENEEIIRKFEEKCKKSLSKQTGLFNGIQPGVQNRLRRANQIGLHNLLTTNFLLGVFSGLLVTFMILMLIPKKKIPHNELSISLGHFRNKYFKKSDNWNSDEIQEWLYQLGPWTSDFSNAVYNINMGTVIIGFN